MSSKWALTVPFYLIGSIPASMSRPITWPLNGSPYQQQFEKVRRCRYECHNQSVRSHWATTYEASNRREANQKWITFLSPSDTPAEEIDMWRFLPLLNSDYVKALQSVNKWDSRPAAKGHTNISVHSRNTFLYALWLSKFPFLHFFKSFLSFYLWWN